MTRCPPGRTACTVLALLLAGCSTVPGPVEQRRYACDGGREFALFAATGVETALLEFQGMQFEVHAEPAPAGERWRCSVLVLDIVDGRGSLAVDGAAPWRDCRPVGD